MLLSYLRKRAMTPLAREPKPSRPMSGRGEAVCGSPLAPALWSCCAFASAEVAAALWSEVLWPADEVAVWSEALGVVELAALWSAAAPWP